MDHRSLEINVASAKDLKDVNLISKMDVYVIVEIAGDPYNHKQKTKTKVDHDGGKNPAWNFPMKFTVLESALQDNRLSLAFKLRCDRVLGDVDIGEVVVPIKELLDSAADCKSGMKLVTYQVRKPSGKGKGELTFSYKFGDVVKGQEAVPPPPPPVFTAYSAQSAPSPSYQTVASTPPPPAGYPAAPPPPAGYPAAAPPPAGYPAAPPPPSGYPAAPPSAGYPAAAPPPAGYPYPPPAAGAGYPQAPAGYAYPPAYGSYPPPPAGYGYPPPAAGYGYPAYPPPPAAGYGYQQQQLPQKNNLGMGLGAGLLGGAVGGLLIGEMLSDAGSYDAGYDAGFDDGFGF